MIKILDLQRKITAYLENAFDIGYEKVSNQIWSASFSLPINDPKNQKVQLLKYVEIDDVGLFRIIPKQTKKSANTITYQCEHVLATLLGSTLFKYHQLTNYTTKDSLQYLIDQQKEKHWKLGVVEFTRYFSYSWENENLLSAIFSVPKGFDEQYRWTFDTDTYPWTLNLVRPDTEPLCRIKEGYNLIDFEIEENPMSIYNRIYPLGVGEGVNQLGIESVNNGVPYIEDAESIAENGIIETVWVDKRFEDAATLKANGEAVLKKWKEPIVTWSVSAADVSSITKLSVDELKEGKVVRIQLDDYPELDLRIMKESKSDMIGNPGDVRLEIGNLSEDLSTTEADMERRQRINELVSQGATNIDSYTFNDNVDNAYPAVIEFPFPEDMINVNQSILRIKTTKFRSYSKAIEGGGSSVSSSTTESGGESVQTTTTADGGAVTKTTTFKPFTSLQILSGVPESWDLDGGAYHYHYSELNGEYLGHDHEFEVPQHKHSFTVNIPGHTHSFTVTIPAHTHGIQYGIWEYEDLPTSLTVKIDGQIVEFSGIDGEIDITEHLRKENGKVTRDYHTIEVLPNDLARINLIITNRFFVQSRIGGTF